MGGYGYFLEPHNGTSVPKLLKINHLKRFGGGGGGKRLFFTVLLLLENLNLFFF